MFVSFMDCSIFFWQRSAALQAMLDLGLHTLNQSKTFFALDKKCVAQLVRLLMASNMSPQTENEQLRARAVKKQHILPTPEQHVLIL